MTSSSTCAALNVKRLPSQPPKTPVSAKKPPIAARREDHLGKAKSGHKLTRDEIKRV